jgi:plastocyanin
MLRIVLSAIVALVPLVAIAADEPEFKLTIHDHRFSPAELVIPANTRIKLVVDNQDATAEEFESHQLDREKIVTGNASVNVSIGPLRPGRYAYFGDFHQATAQGMLIAK